MPKPRSLFSVLAVVLLGTLTWSGCGGEKETNAQEETISQEGLAKSLKADYRSKVGWPLTKVSCDDVKAENGVEVTCEGVDEGGTEFQITGEVKSRAESAKPEVQWGDRTVLRIGGGHYELLAEDLLNENSSEEFTDASCPGTVAPKAGERLTCTVKVSGAKTEITLITTDDSEGFRIATAP